MRNCLIILIFILTFNGRLAAAQKKDDTFRPGYVVTLSGDTLKGYVKIKDHYFNAKNCIYKETSSTNEKTFSASEILAYGAQEKYYKVYEISGQSGNEKVFLECLILGSVSLFQFDDKFFLVGSNEMKELEVAQRVITKGDKIFNTTVELYKVDLNEAMKECPTIVGLIGKTKLVKKDLLELYSGYYNCIGKTFREFKSPESKTKINFVLSIGSGVSGLVLNSGGNSSYEPLKGENPNFTIPTIVSGQFEVSQFTAKNRAKIRIGLNVVWVNNKLHHNSPIAKLDYELATTSTRIEIPIGLRYSFNASDHGLYVFGGIGLNSFLKWSDKLVITSTSSGNVQGVHSDFNNAKLFPSIFAGFGYNCTLGSKKLFFEFDYNRAFVFSEKSNTPVANVVILGLKTGIKF